MADIDGNGNAGRKNMDHLTYQGAAGANLLGGFRTESFGFGDSRFTALVRFFDNDANGPVHHAHLNLGLSLPTGSIEETGQILTPTGAMPTPRLPYPMQLGSGTFDFAPGMTYTGATDSFSWGAQYQATIRAGGNDAGYALGDAHQATSWVQYGPAPWIALSARTAFRTQAPITGADPAIVAPVQTADPDFQGGERIDLGVGVSLSGQGGVIEAGRFAVEVVIPVYQNLDGPQLENDWQLTLGFKKAF